ncbi:hypothetical protein J3459_014984 [Metarhizium acridum]|nr:hypothetical protein J3459_014984 [Metarhizium acridum]
MPSSASFLVCLESKFPANLCSCQAVLSRIAGIFIHTALRAGVALLDLQAKTPEDGWRPAGNWGSEPDLLPSILPCCIFSRSVCRIDIETARHFRKRKRKRKRKNWPYLTTRVQDTRHLGGKSVIEVPIPHRGKNDNSLFPVRQARQNMVCDAALQRRRVP